MRRLLSLGVAAGVAIIIAAPGAALATGGPARAATPTVTASPSPTPAPGGKPTATPTPSTTKTPAPTKSATPKPSPTKTKAPPPKKKPKPKPPKPPAPKPRGPGGAIVSGPHMYIPGTTDSHYADASTVTVSQVKSLVNQMVVVSWTGFSPSSQPIYDNTATDYPVMVAQCRVADPTTPDQCYDATNGGTPAAFGAYGPGNNVYSTTEPNGTGQTEILLFTSVQNQWLGCGPDHPCSIVVVPSQGGNSLTRAKPVCSDHTQDTQALDLGQYAFTSITSPAFTPNGFCSWQDRIVIPLYFAPTPNGCPLRNADFSASGSPMLADAMEQWQAGICFNSNSVEISYNSEVNESEARTAFANGVDDVAFTSQPMSGPTKYPYTYAPVAVSAATVDYWVDNGNTGQPLTNIKMDPRLVAKLLTTSYAYTNDACPAAAGGPFGCDKGVDGNPENLYADPEFQQLNPGDAQVAAQPSGYEIPLVVSGDSDMTWVTTSWIAANSDASSFLAGQFDQWGTHVNTYYLGLKYPTDAFLPMDPYFPVSQQYSPVYPLSLVGSDQALNQPPGTMDTRDVTTGNYDALPPEVPGDRDLWAIDDEADSARFLFPTAALENPAGKYVRPTMESMAAAVKDMTVNPDGITRSINESSKDPAEYPLTMVIYAVVPTGGISKTKAAKIAAFLDYVANQGQLIGSNPGELAPGYLPLTSALRAQTLAAAYKVLHQTGNPKPKKPAPSKSPTSSKSPSAAKSPKPSASKSNSATAHSVAVSFSSADSIGMSWVVLALLIAGIVFVVTGPAALIAGSPGARAALGARARRLTRPRSWRPGGGTPSQSGRGTHRSPKPSGNRPGASRPKRGMTRPTWRRNS
jgi:hypothetical protein